MSGYDVERVEALLRERAHGLTRTPLGTNRGIARDEHPTETSAPPSAPAAVLEPEHPVAQAPRRHSHHRGACKACDRPIGQGRLGAVPDAVRCIDCQFAFEAGQLAPQAARV